MYKPTNQEILPWKMFLVFIKKDSWITIIYFTMSNYSYRLLSKCDKQLGSHLATRDHPRPDKDGGRALATEDKKSHVVRLVATVLYPSPIKDH